jgi:hypothetical protein
LISSVFYKYRSFFFELKKVLITSLFILCLAILFSACEKPIEPAELKQESELLANLDEVSPVEESGKKPILSASDDCDVDYNNLRVLFIGNSFTANFTTDIPAMFEGLALASGKSVGQVATSAIVGYTLQQHASYLPTINLINQGNWDFVILQPNSGFLANGNVNPFNSGVNALTSLINQNSNNATILLFQVVPPANYSASSSSQYQILQQGFNTLFAAKANQFSNMYVVNVGSSFTLAYAGAYGYTNSNQLRYDSQFQYHFFNSGGFLAAVNFYTAIFRTKPCIPVNMTFYLGGGSTGSQPVAVNVPQYHELAQIGYVLSRTSAMDRVSISSCSDIYQVGEYPDCSYYVK